MTMLDPFDDFTLLGVDLGRQRLVLLERNQPDRYAIRWLDVHTRAVVSERTFAVERTRGDEVAERMADWWWYRYGARFPNLPERRFKDLFVDAVGRPRFLPPVTSMIVSATGHVWLEGPPRSPADSQRWTILSPDGDVIGTVDVPPRRKVLAIHGDTALVLEDEESVATYRILLRPASAR